LLITENLQTATCQQLGAIRHAGHQTDRATGEKPRAFPTLPTCETAELARRAVLAHGAVLAKAAALVVLTTSLFAGAGMVGTAAGDSLLALQHTALVDWLEQQGLSADDLQSAVAGLERASETAKLLAGLPK
jgi:predicted GNAT family acetyltransferase